MKFKNEYLGYFHRDGEYEKAQLLWLWYDYHTEVFDRSLWSARPSKSDETMVALMTPLAHAESNKNAMKVRKYMYEVAKRYNISLAAMHKAKVDGYRSVCEMQVRMDIYLKLDKSGGI